MANRFDTPQKQEYVSQYVPMPLEYLSGLAKDYTNQYKKAEEDVYALGDLMTKVNAMPKHEGYKEELAQKYAPKVESLADQFVKGADLPSATRELNKLKREWVNDPVRQELESSYANYQQYQKDKIAKGDKYGEYYDPFLPFKGGSPEAGIQGFRYTGMGEIQNHQKLAMEMMDKIAKDANEYDNVQLGEDGIIRGYKGGKEEILDSKVRGLAQQKVPSFLLTKEGQDFAKMISYNNPNIDIGKAAEEYLYTAGANQIFTNKSYGNKIDVTGLANDIRKEQQANLTTTGQSEALSNAELDLENVKGMSFNPDGSLKAPNLSKWVNKPGRDEFGVFDPNRKVYESTNELDVNKLKDQQRLVIDLQTKNPALKGLSPKATIEAYTKAMKSVNSESIPLNKISGEASKAIGESIAIDKLGRNFYVYDSEGKTEDGTLKTVLKKLDITEEELDEALKKGIGGYTQAGPTPGGYYVEVKPKGSETSRRVVVSADSEMQGMFRTSHLINEARKSMKESVIQPIPENPNYKVLVKPNIDKYGNASWQYLEVVTDENGNAIQSNPTTLNAIMESEKENLKKSNYLGSKVGSIKPNTVK
jgi:hypothetical protein